ncbi:MAG: ABC-ATPase domain-containing protein [Fibrobacterales bacterium]
MKKLFIDLQKLKKKSFGAYKALKGRYQIGNIGMQIYHIQGDPFAQPSKVSLRIPLSESGYDVELYDTREKSVAFCDFLHRLLHSQTDFYSESCGSGKSGVIAVPRPCQQVLERSVVQISEEFLEVRINVGLPAQGREIDIENAVSILTDFIPSIATSVLLSQNCDLEALATHTDLYVKQCQLRAQLKDKELIAFIANGSVLPRAAGNVDTPLTTAVRFLSPESLSVTMDWGDTTISGLGIAKGITLIVGGGYHGKSTLLKALDSGIYNHIAGDGREQIVACEDAVKIRAEEGRSIADTDISYFINNLPGNNSTEEFSTTNASGSTSQAANVIDALELGSQTLLVDEDISAVNFLVRDLKMQELIPGHREPITPLLHRMKSLKKSGISLVVVAGASGDFIDCADTVIAMDTYVPRDVTARALEIAQKNPALLPKENVTLKVSQRVPHLAKLNEYVTEQDKGRFSAKIRVKGCELAVIGREEIDLRAIDHFVCSEQLRTIAGAIHWGSNAFKDDGLTLREFCEKVVGVVKEHSLDYITSAKSGDLAEIRPLDIGLTINRMRSLVIARQKKV